MKRRNVINRVCVTLVALALTVGASGWAAENPGVRVARTYLSDSDPVYRALEDDQQAEAEELKRNFPDLVEKPIWPLDEKMLRAQGLSESQVQTRRDQVLLEMGKPLPTRYENPRLYERVRQIKKKLDFIAAVQTRNDVNIRVGTMLRIGENPETKQVGNEKVILVPRFMFTFVQQMTQIAFATLSTPSVKDREALANRLMTFVDAFASGTPNIPIYRKPLSFDQLILQTRMVEAMETFVLAHEYIHVLENHKPTDPARTASSGDRKNTVRRSWKQELPADLLGYKMMVLANSLPHEFDKNYPALSALLLLAPSLFFRYEMIVEDARLICENLALPSEPDPALRDEVVALFQEKALELVNQNFISDSGFERLSGHPPPWARYIYIDSFAAVEFRSGPKALDREANQYFGTGLEVSKGMWDLWLDSRKSYLTACINKAAALRNSASPMPNEEKKK